MFVPINSTTTNVAHQRYATTPRRLTVSEFEHVVLVRNGIVLRTLPSGTHRLRPRRDRIIRFPVAPQVVIVPGQEMMTADGAGVRVTVAVTYRVTEPITAARAMPFHERLYLRAQLAARAVIGRRGLEQLLAERNQLDGELTEHTAASVVDAGLSVDEVVVRDLVVPGALRSAVADVISARLAGQATLERARGETAALRSLANAARMAQDNPTLLQLRWLQHLGSTGNTVVLGGGVIGSPSANTNT